jgi:hypothetical protein
MVLQPAAAPPQALLEDHARIKELREKRESEKRDRDEKRWGPLGEAWLLVARLSSVGSASAWQA